MNDHIRSYSKAYAGAASAGVSTYLTTIIVWLVSLSGVTIPTDVKDAIAGLLVAVVTGVIVAYVPTLEPKIDVSQAK